MLGRKLTVLNKKICAHSDNPASYRQVQDDLSIYDIDKQL